MFIHIALRGAILYDSFQLYDAEVTLGITFNYKGFYIDIGVLTEGGHFPAFIDDGIVGLGYQMALSN